MTRTVWKYTIDIEEGDKFTLEIPGGGTFLYLKSRTFDSNGFLSDPNLPKIDTWWAVDTDNVPVEVELFVTGTGHEVPPSVNYLGTAFPMPAIVLHVWQKDQVFQDMHIVDGKFVPKSQ